MKKGKWHRHLKAALNFCLPSLCQGFQKNLHTCVSHVIDLPIKPITFSTIRFSILGLGCCKFLRFSMIMEASSEMVY